MFRQGNYLKAVALFLGVLWLLLLKGSWGVAADFTDPFSQVVEHKLKNGMQVLILREPRAPLVSHQIWYRVGSRHERLGKTGLSHLTEHLMFKATEKYAAKEFSRLVQKAGGSDNAFTGKDYTAYFQNGPKTELRRWMEMEAHRMRHLKVSEEDFDTEKKVVLEERRFRTEDDPVSQLVEETMAGAFKAHPYEWPVIGWYHDIESLTREDFLKHYNTYYQPNNATLVVVGDVDPKEVVSWAEAIYGAIPPASEPPPVTAKEPPQQGERRLVLQREAQLPYLIMAYHVPNWQSPDCFVLELLVRLLAKGKSSRLYHNLVYKERLALDAGADYDLDTADPSLFLLYGQPLPGRTVIQLERALEGEIRKLQTELVEPRELEKAKNQVTAAFYMSMDSLFYRGMVLGKLATVARWTLVREFIPQVQKVTAADLRRVAQQYLVPHNRTIGVLQPLRGTKTQGGGGPAAGSPQHHGY
jgi:zinc protease|uniref:Insulinase family protein n=1 Tax=Desulfobacca acetoxidans TaxID=60893 RepID=A0A7C5ENL8_9BACT